MSEASEWFRKMGYRPDDIFTAGDMENAFNAGMAKCGEYHYWREVPLTTKREVE